MKKLAVQLWFDEGGLIISAELVLVLTLAVLGMIVGINAVAGAVNNEMNDISSAFGSLNQSFSYQGFWKAGHASVSGSAYLDAQDYCDCTVMAQPPVENDFHGTYVAPPVVDIPCPNGDCTSSAPCDDCVEEAAEQVPCNSCETEENEPSPINKPADTEPEKLKPLPAPTPAK